MATVMARGWRGEERTTRTVFFVRASFRMAIAIDPSGGSPSWASVEDAGAVGPE